MMRFLGLILIFACLSCGKSYKQEAEEKLNYAVNLCEKGDSVNALIQLDSVQILYPEAFETTKKAKDLTQKINSEFLFRKQEQLDKINGQLADLEKMFDKEKTEYDRYTQYIHKRQGFKRRWNQSFIQLHLDERGELYISSNYYGEQWLNHIGLRVYDGVFQAKTDTVSLTDPNNHHSEFMNTHWEKVSYMNGKDNGVIQFIADNAERNLKAVFLGQRMYFIVLEQFDKQAVKDALALSNALKLKTQLEKDIKNLQAKVG
jgi:predicted double-glycine peptidase